MKIGDIATVKDCGRMYLTFSDWFKRNDVDVEYACRYDYNRDNLHSGDRVEIIDIHPHHITKKNLCLVKIVNDIENDYFYYTYLIDEEGLSPIKRMTKEEIERELGYSIEIVE